MRTTVTSRGLLLASHPVPALTVTALVTVLALAVGAPAQVAAGTALAVLAGQASVGWSNDAADAADDVAAARTTKPVVRGMVDSSALWWAALGALSLTVVVSLVAMGPLAGGLHVAAVLAAWAYNLRLKDTPFSPLPYAVAFGLLPVVVAELAQPPVQPEVWWAVVCACVGVAAHLANTAGDVESDRRVGRGGLSVLIGGAAARAVCVVAAAVAAAVLLGSLPDVPAALVAWALVCLAGLVVAASVRGGAWLFPAVMLAAVVNAGLVLVLTAA